MNYLVDFRASDSGGAVVRGVVRGGAGLGTEFDLRREAAVTFLVHGFNVNRTNGTAGFGRLVQHLPLVGDAAYVGILWPGDQSGVGPFSYPFEGNDADDSARELTRFISDVIAGGAVLSFVSHSLGARVVMEVIKALRPSDYPIREVCLMAAALDDFSLAHPKNYLGAVPKTRRVAVLASRRDMVLRLAYPAGDVLQAFMHFRVDRAGLALGMHGPKPSGAHPIPREVYHEQIPDARGSGHGDYFPRDPISQNQTSALAFARDVLQGVPAPRYL